MGIANGHGATPVAELDLITARFEAQGLQTSPARRLAGQFDEGFLDAGDLSSVQGQETVAAARRGGEAREAIRFDGHLAGSREVEIATVRPHGIKGTREVPRGPL